MAHKTTAGEIVRSLRNLADMTQEDLAEVANTSAAYISRVENGIARPTPQWIGNVAAAAGARIKATATHNTVTSSAA